MFQDSKINETSVDYVCSTANKGNQNAQRGQNKTRGGKPNQQ
jgi:hypothetical protein